MRAWLSPQIGTGGRVTVPVDPPIEIAPDDWADPEVPEFQTSKVIDDELRPQHPTPNGGMRPILDAPNFASDPIWLVLGFDETAAPDGSLDLGDPSSDGWLTALLTVNQKITLRARLGGSVSFWQRDWRRGQLLVLFLGGDPFSVRSKERLIEVIDRVG